MPIERIKRLRNYRIFKDFEWPATLPTFARYNLVYGWNGAGKTSLSSLLRNCQTKTAPEGEVELTVNGQAVRGADFPNYDFPEVRVFNRDFVDRNVFEDPSRELPPVFVLGEDSKAKQEELNELLAQQEELTGRVKTFAASEEKATAALNRFCTDQARSIRNLLSRDPRYNAYEAPRFKEAVKAVAAATPRPALLTMADRQEKEGTHNASTMKVLEAPALLQLDVYALTERVRAALSKSVVAASISALVENPKISAWVQQGLHIHSGETRCHFCAGPLDAARLEALQGHFNNELKALQDELHYLEGHVEESNKAIRRWNPPQTGQLYNHLHFEYDNFVAAAGLHSSLLLDYLGRLKLGLEAKKGLPFKSLNDEDFHVPAEMLGRFSDAGANNLPLDLQLEEAYKGARSIDNIRLTIEKHNKLTENFAEEVRTSRSALERDEVVRALPEWENLQGRIDVLAEEHKTTRDKLTDLAEPIKNLRRSILQHMTPAEELNKDMTSYLGRNELTFEVRDTGYLVRRGGQPATHLSDGERTAIAFMYFLKSLTDSSFDLANGVVVIDDPVSSLDANSLYCAFGFMKERTRDAGQLFVLTHNFAFFRQVKNWFNHLGGRLDQKGYDPQKSKKVHFYMLGTTYVGAQRQAHIRSLDPLLHEHESEYHYLFQQVWAGSLLAAPENLETVYGMPNVARRLLEHFAAFRAPHVGGLDSKIQAMEGTAASKARIVRFLHTHSHADNISEPEHDLTLLSETPAVLFEVLAFMKNNDERHHDAMIALVRPAQPEANAA